MGRLEISILSNAAYYAILHKKCSPRKWYLDSSINALVNILLGYFDCENCFFLLYHYTVHHAKYAEFQLL